MDYVSQFFIDLYAQYGDGHDLLGFSLDGIAEIVILDDDDNVNGLYLPTVPDRLGVRTKTWTYKSGGSPCIPTRNE
jgi:hypothetical protein